MVQEILRELSDGQEHKWADLRAHIGKAFQITTAEAAQRLPSDRETVLANRIRNALFGMRKRGLAHFVSRDVLKITPKGLASIKTAQVVLHTTRQSVPGASSEG
jgi:restriction system protein